MKIKTLSILLLTLGLSACASTWDGIKDDASRNSNKAEANLKETGDAIERQWDRTKEGTQKRLDSTGNAIKEGWQKLSD